MKLLISALALGALAVATNAASLNLFYTCTPDGGMFDYNMTLAVDESSSSWSPGMGWTWTTFGDVPNATSPLSDFNLTSAPPSPYGSLASSSGGHNGPTWLFDASNNVVYWVPATATDTLTWSGTSAFDGRTQGSLQFSELLIEGGATQDNYKDMIVQSAPEPASLLTLGVFVPLVLRRRKKA